MSSRDLYLDCTLKIRVFILLRLHTLKLKKKNLQGRSHVKCSYHSKIKNFSSEWKEEMMRPVTEIVVFEVKQ